MGSSSIMMTLMRNAESDRNRYHPLGVMKDSIRFFDFLILFFFVGGNGNGKESKEA